MSLEVQVIITLIHISLLTLEDLSIAKCKNCIQLDCIKIMGS